MVRLRQLRPPAGVQRVTGGERLLAYATVEGGGFVVATLTALHLPETTGLGRLAWDQVVHASWAQPRLALSVQPVPAGSVVDVHLDLVDAGSLPPVLRERVTASIVAERHVVLSGRLGARFLARRTEAGDVRWSVLFDDGLDAADPRLRARADEALAALRSSWGV